jgi:hypothetical protein
VPQSLIAVAEPTVPLITASDVSAFINKAFQVSPHMEVKEEVR